MSKFNKDMTMGEILAINPDAREVLEGFGMHCCGCPVSQAEALEDACKVHDIDVEMVLEQLEELEELTDAECCCDGHCSCCEDECDDDCDCGCQDK